MAGTTFGPGASGRNAGLRRVLLLLRQLQDQAVRPTVPELAARLQVTPRTVYRDLALLEELHFRLPPPACEAVDA